MTAHPHAELMRLYAEDAAETDRPWERWELLVDADTGVWECLGQYPLWHPCHAYRRRVPARCVDWGDVRPGTLIQARLPDDSGWSDSKLFFVKGSVNDPLVIVREFTLSGARDVYFDSRSRLAPTDWFFHEGLGQPVPDGVMVEWQLRGDPSLRRREPIRKSEDAGILSWSHDPFRRANDIIAYRITGELADGYRWY